MKFDDCEIVLDQVTKFFDTIYIGGWFNSPTQTLKKIDLADIPNSCQLTAIGLRHEGVEQQLGPAKGFRIQALLEKGWKDSLKIRIATSSRKVYTVDLLSLAEDRISMYKSRRLGSEFIDLIKTNPDARILDIGGRNRSGLDRSEKFPGMNYVVLDVLPGENVDVVCDAHEMSKAFETESFDFIVSYSVFEHLLMPWKVALEMNRLLKPGGQILVATHQTLGLHDAPWDFWRFSSDSWDALFNKRTGFRIVERVQDFEQFILPFIIRDGKKDAEKAAGFEASLVIAEKISRTTIEWDVSLSEIIDTSYVSGISAQNSSPLI